MHPSQQSLWEEDQVDFPSKLRKKEAANEEVWSSHSALLAQAGKAEAGYLASEATVTQMSWTILMSSVSLLICAMNSLCMRRETV